jgi:hypothetical protein
MICTATSNCLKIGVRKILQIEKYLHIWTSFHLYGHKWSIPVSFFANGYDPCFFITRGRDRMVDGCYLWNQCLSVLTLWVRIPLRRGVLDTTLCDKVCLWLAECRWFHPGTPLSSTNKTDRHDIIELLLKMTLYTITLFVTAILLSLSLQKNYYTELYHIIERDLEITLLKTLLGQ